MQSIYPLRRLNQVHLFAVLISRDQFCPNYGVLVDLEVGLKTKHSATISSSNNERHSAEVEDISVDDQAAVALDVLINTLDSIDPDDEMYDEANDPSSEDVDDSRDRRHPPNSATPLTLSRRPMKVFNKIFTSEGAIALVSLEKDVKSLPDQNDTPKMKGKMHYWSIS